jgi:translation elongation factor EF-Tu-like GTPase
MCSYNVIMRLFSTENGGRKNPIFSGYRPNLTIDSNQYYSCEIKLLDKEILYPGDECKAKVVLISTKSEEFKKELETTDIFYITEGTKMIGTGITLK